MANALKAILNIEASGITDIGTFYRSSNRINHIGDSLEAYVKDAFCNSFQIKDESAKNEVYNSVFSYLGNQKNPPDMILRKGDAIEVKKIEARDSSLALNSSYPKDKLFSDSSMISEACRSCEDWSEKDLIYVIGKVSGTKLKSMWFVHGECYAAQKETYEKIKEKISQGVNALPEVEFSETNEIGRVNKVDPLGITYLRIRGMWGIDNPEKVFSYLDLENMTSEFKFTCLMTKQKFDSFPKEDINTLIMNPNIKKRDVKINSPNNPANLLDAVLISFLK